MADLSLNILVVNTYNKLTLGVADISTYPDSPAVINPSLEIDIPGFGVTSVPFVPNQFNVLNSTILGITESGDDLVALPDGIYTITYSVTPAYENYVTKTIQRIDQLQEMFDNAFMKLDMMECDMAIKTQSKKDLLTVYFFIQGSIAAANNCAVDTANTLYRQASNMLGNLIRNNCGCTGSNYLINFN